MMIACCPHFYVHLPFIVRACVCVCVCVSPGRTSVASSKPLRSVHGLHDPSHTADDAPGDLGGATLGLLRGDPSFHRPRGAAAAAGLGGTAVTRTVNNFTAQLLAEGTTLSGSSGQLHALLAQRAPAGGSGAAAAWGGAGGDLTSDSALLAAHNRLQGGNNGGVGNRDEMTFASSVGPAGGSARGGAAGGAAGANNRREHTHTHTHTLCTRAHVHADTMYFDVHTHTRGSGCVNVRCRVCVCVRR